jgi:hypothetical protein
MEEIPTGWYTKNEGNNKKRKRKGETTETINNERLPKSNKYKMNATNVRPEGISSSPFLTAYNPDAMFETRTNSRGPIDSEALINAQRQGQISKKNIPDNKTTEDINELSKKIGRTDSQDKKDLQIELDVLKNRLKSENEQLKYDRIMLEIYPNELKHYNSLREEKEQLLKHTSHLHQNIIYNESKIRDYPPHARIFQKKINGLQVELKNANHDLETIESEKQQILDSVYNDVLMTDSEDRLEVFPSGGRKTRKRRSTKKRRKKTRSTSRRRKTRTSSC